MKYSIEDIKGIVKGEWLAFTGSTANIDHLLLDSRKIVLPATSLFFALEGPRRNGHRFIAELYEKGVLNFIVSESIPVDNYPGINCILVKDVLHALQVLAAYHRRQFSIPVIGITGSNGKTIVKEWLNQLLEEKYVIVRSPKSYNSQIGVPLSIWQMNKSHQLGIFEAGISESGEMDKLEKIIQPTIGVFTNIGEAHSEGFLDIRQKVNEKLQLFTHVQALIYCKDYPSVNESIAAYVKQLRGASLPGANYMGWSARTAAALRITNVLKQKDGARINASYNGAPVSIQIPFTDDASIEDAITCWAVLVHLNIDHAYLERQFLKLAPVAMRLELKKGMNNSTLINDSYSADLSSLKIALDFLSQQHQHAKRTVILSDILQSGRNEVDLYTEIANTLQQKSIHRLIGIGQSISKHRYLFESVKSMSAVFYPDVDALLKDFFHLEFGNETILLKGARVFKFEQVSQLLEHKVHQTVLEINQNALIHNLKAYQRLLKPATRLMAMVKAFSYGSGSYEIASLLQYHKVDYLAVAYADEGVELRKGGITLPVMVMNPQQSTFEALVQYQLEPDIYAFNILDDFDSFLKNKGLQQFPVHIELETGMNRLGFPLAGISLLTEKLQAGRFNVRSVFTHLAASEDPAQDAFTQRQAGSYLTACGTIRQALGYSFIRHIGNSAAIYRHPRLQLDMVRLGIGLYGISTTPDNILNLEEVTTLKTTIAQIKYLLKGETVGYGRRGVTLHDTVIATVRLGYADGYPRRLSNGRGKMLVQNRLAPVIGTVCMDMTMLDITGIPEVAEGDEVIVFGKQLPIQLLAKWAETIPYEVMTGISQRVKRVYFEES